MNSIIGALRVSLGLDSAQFESGLKKSKSEIDGFANAAKVGFAAIAAAAAAAVAGMTVGIKSAITYADEIDEASQKAGVGAEALSRLGHAAKVEGLSIEQLSGGLQKLTRSMSDAVQNGTGQAAAGFSALGVEIQSADGSMRAADAVFVDLAGRFGEMEDGADKTALAMQIFGRTGADLIPLLNYGADGLQRMAEEADALGLTIDGSTAAAAGQFNDNLARLGQAAQGFANQMMMAVLPALVAATDGLVWLSQNTGMLVAGFVEIARYAGVAGAALVTYFGPSILAMVGAMATAIGTTMVGAVRALSLAMVANPIGLLVAAIAGAIAAAFLFRDEIQQAIGVDVVGIFKSVANAMVGLFKGAYDAVIVAWSMLPAAFADIFTMAMNSAIDIVQNGINGVIGALRNIPGLGEMQGTDLSQFKGETTGAAAALPGAMSEAMLNAQKDYIGEWSEAISLAWGTAADAVSGFNLQVTAANDNANLLTGTAETTAGAMGSIADSADVAKAAMGGLGDAFAANAERMAKAMKETSGRVAGTLDSITQAMGQSGDEQFGIVKAISIASALIKGWEAVTSSYAAGAALGGPPLGMLYAGLAAAQTAAQIASMQSVTSSSSGTPRATSAASVPDAPQRQQADRQPDRMDITLHGLDRNAMYTGDNVERLIGLIEERSGDGRILNIKVA